MWFAASAAFNFDVGTAEAVVPDNLRDVMCSQMPDRHDSGRSISVFLRDVKCLADLQK